MRIAFFCIMGDHSSREAHHLAEWLIQQHGLQGIETYYAGTYDQVGQHSEEYHFARGQRHEKMPLSEFDVIVPLNPDAQRIMNMRLRLLTDARNMPRIERVDEHRIDPDHLDPHRVLELLKKYARKPRPKVM